MTLLCALFVGIAKCPTNIIGVAISLGKAIIHIANHLISGGRAVFADTHTRRDTYRILALLAAHHRQFYGLWSVWGAW